MEVLPVSSQTLRRRLVSVVAIAGLALWALPAGAQSLTASITGKVNDESGAAVPGATVVVTNAETNVNAWNGTSDASGVFHAPSLPVGRYNIAVSLSGFKNV